MTKKISLGIGVFLGIVVLLWGVWGVVGRQGTGSTVTVNIPASKTDHRIGKENAKVTLVEFSDFQCPACKAYHPMVKEVLNKHKNNISYVYKYYPLPIHKNAQSAAFVAEAAGKQGKFFEMQDMLFEKQDEWSESKNPQKLFASYAKGLKIDMDKFNKDIDLKETKDVVQKDIELGNQIGVDATPSFYLNGKRIQGMTSADGFDQLINEELKKVK